MVGLPVAYVDDYISAGITAKLQIKATVNHAYVDDYIAGINHA